MPAFGVKTNERPGTRAQVRYSRMSAYKAREVLDLIRGKEVQQALEILQFVERDAAIVIRKCLASAMANAEHNVQIDCDELYVSACFADEGPTLKRWRPRARGRATRIRKRTCHITVIVSRLPEDKLERKRAKEATRPGSRAARVAGQQLEQEGRRRRRRGRKDAAAAEAGVVDATEPIVDAIEAEEAVESDVIETVAEEAGIVDTTEAAVEQAEEVMEEVAPEAATADESPEGEEK